MNLSKLVRDAQVMLNAHSPEILTGLGISGMITTTVLAVMATPKALKKLDDKKKELDVEKLSAKETIKTAGPCYIPSVAVGAVSVACLIGATSVNCRRNAALAAAYTLSVDKLSTYQDKVTEIIGEKKEESIRDEIAKDKIRENPSQNREIIVTGNGDTKCYDVLSDRYFYSSIDKIRSAVADLNRQMLDDRYITLNEYYYAIGLKGTKEGELLGWHIDRGYIDIHFSSVLDESCKTPCISVDCDIEPVACPNY